MDSVLKVVYDKWVDLGTDRVPMPNGIHPLVYNAVQENINKGLALHQAYEMARRTISGDVMMYDHSNFWGYTGGILEFVEIPENPDPNVVYVLPVEVRGSIEMVVRENRLEVNGEQTKYFLHNTFTDRTFDLIKAGVIKILINMAQDPIDICTITNIEQYFVNINVDPANVILIGGNDNAADYAETFQGRIKISPVTTLLLQQTARTSMDYPVTTSLKYVSDIVRESDLDNTVIRPHRFHCFNRTMKPHRYALAYHAVKTGLLQDNIFSFLNSFGATSETVHENLTRFFPDSAEILYYSQVVCDLIPYHVDTHGLDESGRGQMTSTNNRKDLYLNSYVNIVSETAFITEKKPFISEKLWKPVMNLQPFVVVGNYQTLKTIREMGFKTFEPFIDESYDEVYNHKERMQLILKEIDKLNQMPIEKLHEWYYSITDILIHNKEHLKTFANTNPYQVAFDDIINTYRK